jgi:hypothetical protein
MSSFQRIIAGVCLGALLSPELVTPSMAAAEAAPAPQMPKGSHLLLAPIPLDLRAMGKDGSGGAHAMAQPVAPAFRSVSLQTSGGGWAGLSTAKKTWIIVGIVVGTIAIVAVVSNGGDGSDGGGGY